MWFNLSQAGEHTEELTFLPELNVATAEADPDTRLSWQQDMGGYGSYDTR